MPNQQQFDQDLSVTHDDTTEATVPLPEEEEGFHDNPIKRIFEQDYSRCVYYDTDDLEDENYE